MPETGNSTNNHQAFLRLEELLRDPHLRVLPEQRGKIVGNIVHSVMHPYFLKKTAEEQEQFRPKYLEHIRMIEEYCLHEYIEAPEPRLTIELIKGLHRVLYHNSPSVPLKAVDGATTTMTPGELRTTAVMISGPSLPGKKFSTVPHQHVAKMMEQLLNIVNDANIPVFERYFRFIAVFLISIHPFCDSNGKTALVLSDLFLLKQGIQPPYFARYCWENSVEHHRRCGCYRLQSRDISIFYPPLLQLYADCGITVPCVEADSLPAPSLEYQLLTTLLAEAGSAMGKGDLPVSAALTVDQTLVASGCNSVVSSGGRQFHAERNLLASLENTAIPPGRRVLWVTLEPCIRCAQAIIRFGVDEVVYVLDDPFNGGSGLLTKAGITVTRKPEWEAEVLQLVMQFFDQCPEQCADRAYWFFFNHWRSHASISREDEVRAVLLRHLAPYLISNGTPDPLQARAAFLAWIERLTTLAMQGCGAGAPDLDFIRELHRALFPPGHRLHATGNDGVATETGTGEWRRHLLWPRYGSFSATDSIEQEFTDLLERLSALAAPTREDALCFVMDFWCIHPFTDGNGRLSVLLADLFCIAHGLPPLVLDHKHPMLKTALLEAAFVDRAPTAAQLELLDGWNQGRLGIRHRSSFDDVPSVFKTYLARSGNKRYVAEQILARLAGKPSGSPLVITDLGGGTGAIAHEIIHALIEQGKDFVYHFVEPSAQMAGHFRATSRYASLPQVNIHAMTVEEFLSPPSDIILAVQALQHFSNAKEAISDMLASLKPDGVALVTNNHPDSDELRMMAPFGRNSANAHSFLVSFLTRHGVRFHEDVVESVVRIACQDRNSPEGDDLLQWYLNQPAHQVTEEQKEIFWQAVAAAAPDGVLGKKESFFWIGR